MPKRTDLKKILVIGSGPIVIGQAAEFDYAGTQACLALREEGYEVVLANSNPATIMTDTTVADKIYMEPLTLEYVAKILRYERPDAIIPSLGGQTGLNLAMQLEKKGVLRECQVELLGTTSRSIEQAEDRELFKELCQSIGEPTLPSVITHSVEEAIAAAQQIGYPVVLRPAFTLGGTGGGFADDEEELVNLMKNALALSPVGQVLVEKSIKGFKEIEYEVMRDRNDTAITICNMENIDPVGIHTGDSIVVAPSQTLTNKEYHLLRDSALRIIRALRIEGGCNVQFALDPQSFQYYVIEVNPRVSRSSALASKASGYPIARVSAKIAVGMTLDEIPIANTPASFEPALDYVVVKFPKWPFDKFAGASRKLGTQMKATGEVMAIAPTFEAALLKAVRGAEIGLDTLNAKPLTDAPLADRLCEVNDRRIFTVFEALKAGMTVDEIHEVTRIDRFFLAKLQKLADFETSIASGIADDALYARGKTLGYTDAALARLSGTKNLPHTPYAYKTVDTCAAEFDAETPYFYSVSGGACEARAAKRSGKPVIVVLGSGPIRIGQGIEFDYSSVHCVWALQKCGYEVVIINNNPETVSTDYDTADRLYFEPLTEEDVMNVLAVEQPVGVVVAFGGQTAIRLTACLDRAGVRILGTSAEGIDTAEDRERFDALLERFGIRRPRGMGARDTAEALAAAEALGYPVLLRPSYVIGGQNMRIVHDAEEVRHYMRRILAQGIDNPVLVDKYMPGTELEVDVISDGTDVLIPGIMEHVERAGIHSGDSIAVYPPYSIDDRMIAHIADCSTKLAKALGTKGLVNIQYLIYAGELYVIEVNPRASRTVPYISKVTGVPMVEVAARVMLGEPLAAMGYGTGLYRTPPYFAVKVPVFSFEKLADADSTLGPEMKSTGEVLGIGRTLGEALFKGVTASGKHFRMPRPDRSVGVFLSVDTHDQGEIIGLAKKLDDLGFAIFATDETAASVGSLGIDVRAVTVAGSFPLMEDGKISYAVYTGAFKDETGTDYMALSRCALICRVPVFTALDTADAAANVIAGGFSEGNTELVDLGAMRTEKQKIAFAKMEATGDDYIFIDNRDGSITCPESLALTLCDRHRGIGGDGLVLIEHSDIADVKMRSFNRDGSEGRMAGNSIRSVGKYVYDRGILPKTTLTVETASGVHTLTLYTRDGAVTLCGVTMGRADFAAASLPALTDKVELVNAPIEVGGKTYTVTCLSVGNPHCVVFDDRIDALDLEVLGPQFEHAPLFPERINTEFVRVVNRNMLKMRVYERGNGETPACGTGACAAVAAAVRLGLCAADEDVTVKVRGGDLVVRVSAEGITLTGETGLVFEGVVYA